MRIKPVGWEQRLFDFVEKSKGMPFVRGQNCCAVWVLSALDEMCGTTFAGEIQGTFDTEDGAREVMKARGWANLAEGLRAVTGAKQVNRATFAQLGDVIFVPFYEGMNFEGGTLFVCLGRDVVGREDRKKGIVRVPPRQLLPLGVWVYRVYPLTRRARSPGPA